MSVRGVHDIVAAYDAGDFRVLPILRKTHPAPTGLAGWALDGGAFSPGVPSPSYYAGTPKLFTALGRAADGGWDHGPDVAPAKKHLKRLSGVYSTQQSVLRLVDVLGFYPFLDGGTVDIEQACTTLSTPARLRDGEGVQIAIVQQFANSGIVTTQDISIRYVNSRGVERTTDLVKLITDSAVVFPAGAILTRGSATTATSTSGPFVRLASGDSGVREIKGITVFGAPEINLFAAVLMRSVADLPTRHGLAASNEPASLAFVEHDFGRTVANLPVIDDDAYLSFLFTHSLATSFTQFSGGEVFWR
jgi:hypothetical protein